jgi:hypothetical protein
MKRAAAALLLLGCSTPGADLPVRGERTTVLFFLAPGCPIAERFAPEIGRICADYGLRGAAFALVYVDGGPEEVRRHAGEFGLAAPVVSDGGLALARRFGVSVTPEAVVLDASGTRAYRGRINDLYLDLGRYRLQPTTRELRDAVEAVLAGRPVVVREARAVG